MARKFVVTQGVVGTFARDAEVTEEQLVEIGLPVEDALRVGAVAELGPDGKRLVPEPSAAPVPDLTFATRITNLEKRLDALEGAAPKAAPEAPKTEPRK